MFGLPFGLLFCALLCNVSLCEEYCRPKFEHCNCDENSLECHGENKITHMGKLFDYIRDNVTSIVVEGSNIPEIGPNGLGKCIHNYDVLKFSKLRLLNLSNNRIRKIHRKAFICMPYLEELDLSQNELVLDSNQSTPGYFTYLEYLKRLYMKNAFSDVPRNKTIQTNLESFLDTVYVKKLEILILSHNELTTLPWRWINGTCSMTYLKTLDLSHNNLVTNGNHPGLFDYIRCLGGLESLDISYNNLTRLPKFLLENIDSFNKLNALRIGHNSFECNYRFFEMYDWLLKSGVNFDDDGVICFIGNQSLHGKHVMSMLRDELCASNRRSNETTQTNDNPNSTTLSNPLATTLGYQNCKDLVQKIESTNGSVKESGSNKTPKTCETLLNSQSRARGHSDSFVSVIMVTVLMVY